MTRYVQATEMSAQPYTSEGIDSLRYQIRNNVGRYLLHPARHVTEPGVTRRSRATRTCFSAF
jgi:hypothetical protein